jgi:hypothetical protein
MTVAPVLALIERRYRNVDPDLDTWNDKRAN